MDEYEKATRCMNAPMRKGTGERNVDMCKVYGRWVASCEDCAFDTSQ